MAAITAPTQDAADLLSAVRARFPSLSGAHRDRVLADAAGGTQICDRSLHHLTRYLLEANVQNANYPLSRDVAMPRVQAGYNAAALLWGRDVGADQVGFFASATSVTETVSRMVEQSVGEARRRKAGGDDDEMAWREGDEVIVTSADHETNRGAWLRMAERLQLRVKVWHPTPLRSDDDDRDQPFAVNLDAAALAELVTERTRLVAFTACSNVLGTYTDVAACCEVARRASGSRCLTVVDGVAKAPHALLRPDDWGCDVSFLSLYKVYAPHLATAYFSRRALRLLARLNHGFLASSPGLYPYLPSSQQYELVASVAGMVEYLLWLGGDGDGGSGKAPLDGDVEAVAWHELQVPATTTLDAHLAPPPSKPEPSSRAASSTSAAQARAAEVRARLYARLRRAFERMESLERTELLAPLVEFLTGDEARSKGVRLLGSQEADPRKRASTLAFVQLHPSAQTTSAPPAAEGGEVDVVRNGVGATPRPRPPPWRHATRSSAALHAELVGDGRVGAQCGHAYAPALLRRLGLDEADGMVRVSFVHYNSRREAREVVEAIRRAL